MYSDEKHVVTCPAVILWDGVTSPEPSPHTPGKMIYSIKIAMPPGSPEIEEVTALATKALQENSIFRGNLPAGGNWPVNLAKPDDDPSVQGFTVINAKTHNGAPQVFDQHGKQLTPMEYGPQIYPGALVKIIVHTYSFDNKARGIAFGLDGIMIVDATRPRLAISGGIDAAKAFGFGGTPGQATPPPATGAPAPPAAGIQPAPDFLNPPAAPAPTGPTMTAKAKGAPWSSFVVNGWTEEAARAQGYIV